MLCQKCNKNEANVKYTEIINGEKNEMMLCEECSHKLGINNMNFNIPIDFSNFFGGLLEDEIYNEKEFMPLFQKVKELKCDSCNMTYDDFINKGKFGCPECYNVFSNKIDTLLNRLHGSSKYLGRKALKNVSNKIDKQNINLKYQEIEENKIENNIKNKKENENENELEKLQKDLKKAILEERYEDAANIRDEIKKIQKG